MFYNIAFLRNATNIWQKFLHTSRSYGTPLISLLLISTHIAFLRNEKSPNHHIIKSSHYQITKLSHHQIITSSFYTVSMNDFSTLLKTSTPVKNRNTITSVEMSKSAMVKVPVPK